MNLRALLLGVSLFGVACGAENGNDDSTSTIPSVDRATFVREACASFAHCCKGPSICEKTFEAKLATRAWDPILGGACLASLKKSTSCGGDLEEGFGPKLGACTVLLAPGGQKQPGEACVATRDCAASTEGKVECVANRCQLQVVGKVGDTDCIGTLDGEELVSITVKEPPARAHLCSLAEGAFCDVTTHTCMPVGKKDDECSLSNALACGPDAWCDLARNTCMPRNGEKSSCHDTVTSNSCAKTAYCDLRKYSCTNKKADGERCSFSSRECASGICWNGVCGNSALVEAICTK